jgi:hypothetical protein
MTLSRQKTLRYVYTLDEVAFTRAQYNSSPFDIRRNVELPKSRLGQNINHSLLVILCSGCIFDKLTFWRFSISP